ncbi:MAG: double zinc ribbon domain-containing protein [Thiobacillus sp.]
MNIRSIFNQLAPPACLVCGATTRAPVCAGCQSDLPWHSSPHCPVCATPTPQGQVCGACLKRPPAFDRTVAALVYRFPVDRLIPALKYHGRLAIAPALAGCMTPALARAPRPDVIVPMPLHPARLAQRGYNHAAEVARVLARTLGIRLDFGCCRRIRDTPPQQALKLEARRRNVRGAFSCDPAVAGLHIALLDDVMTSGTSLDELAATLKRAGAREVSNWVVARALPPGG